MNAQIPERVHRAARPPHDDAFVEERDSERPFAELIGGGDRVPVVPQDGGRHCGTSSTRTHSSARPDSRRAARRGYASSVSSITVITARSHPMRTGPPPFHFPPPVSAPPSPSTPAP